jgi:ABC-type multidrug transport system ATPase subunit
VEPAEEAEKLELTLRNVTKRYGQTVALDQLSYMFSPGIYGILGSNGAGKSTLLKLISDNLKRDGGQILYDGTEILQLGAAYRGILGYMPQEQGYYAEMTIQTFLQYIAVLKGIPRKEARQQINALLEATNLAQHTTKRLQECSGGMRQRVLLAQAMLGDPKVLILDEPTAGLDPEERIRIRNYIATFSQNRIILLATHIVSDIESISDQILLLDHGQLRNADTPAALLRGVQPYIAEVTCDAETLETLRQNYQIANVRHFNENIIVRIVGKDVFSVPNSTPCIPTLDDVYLFYIAARTDENQNRTPIF